MVLTNNNKKATAMTKSKKTSKLKSFATIVWGVIKNTLAYPIGNLLFFILLLVIRPGSVLTIIRRTGFSLSFILISLFALIVNDQFRDIILNTEQASSTTEAYFFVGIGVFYFGISCWLSSRLVCDIIAKSKEADYRSVKIEDVLFDSESNRSKTLDYLSLWIPRIYGTLPSLMAGYFLIRDDFKVVGWATVSAGIGVLWVSTLRTKLNRWVRSKLGERALSRIKNIHSNLFWHIILLVIVIATLYLNVFSISYLDGSPKAIINAVVFVGLGSALFVMTHSSLAMFNFFVNSSGSPKIVFILLLLSLWPQLAAQYFHETHLAWLFLGVFLFLVIFILYLDNVFGIGLKKRSFKKLMNRKTNFTVNLYSKAEDQGVTLRNLSQIFITVIGIVLLAVWLCMDKKDDYFRHTDNHQIRTIKEDETRTELTDSKKDNNGSNRGNKDKGIASLDYAFSGFVESWKQFTKSLNERISKGKDHQLHVIKHGNSNRIEIPVFFVVSQGGGLRASYWTSVILSELENEFPGIHKQTYSLTGVSGGSVGNVFFATALVNTPNDPIKMQQQLLKAIGEDYLVKVVTSFLNNDLLYRFLPFDNKTFSKDRAEYLEEDWEAGFEKHFGQSEFGLDSGLNALYKNKANSEHSGWLPVIYSLGSEQETGRRVITAPLKPEESVFINMANYWELNTHDAKSGEYIGHRDIRLSTAGLNAARFPLITPPGSMYRQKIEPSHDGSVVGVDYTDKNAVLIRTHLLDGGYFENYGAITTRYMLQYLYEHSGMLSHSLSINSDKHSKIEVNLTPIILVIKNDFGSDQNSFDPSDLAGDCATSAPVREITSMVQGLYSTRSSHTFNSVKELFSYQSLQTQKLSDSKDLQKANTSSDSKELEKNTNLACQKKSVKEVPKPNRHSKSFKLINSFFFPLHPFADDGVQNTNDELLVRVPLGWTLSEKSQCLMSAARYPLDKEGRKIELGMNCSKLEAFLTSSRNRQVLYNFEILKHQLEKYEYLGESKESSNNNSNSEQNVEDIRRSFPNLIDPLIKPINNQLNSSLNNSKDSKKTKQ